MTQTTTVPTVPAIPIFDTRDGKPHEALAMKDFYEIDPSRFAPSYGPAPSTARRYLTSGLSTYQPIDDETAERVIVETLEARRHKRRQVLAIVIGNYGVIFAEAHPFQR